MSETLDRFRLLVDVLREARRAPQREAFEDRPILDRLADLVDAMDDDEQEIANTEGWRGWPDLYDAHMRQRVETVDPDDISRAGDPPRRFFEAA